MLTVIEEVLRCIQGNIRNEGGQAMAQTGLIFGLVAVICIIALTAIGLVVSGNLYDFAMAVDGGSSSLRVN